MIKRKMNDQKIIKILIQKMIKEEDKFSDYFGTDELNKQDEEFNVDKKLSIIHAEDKNNNIDVSAQDQNEIRRMKQEQIGKKQQLDDNLEIIKQDRQIKQILNESNRKQMVQLQQAEHQQVQIENNENETKEKIQAEQPFKDSEQIQEIKQFREPQYQDLGLSQGKNEQNDETSKIQFELVHKQNTEDNNHGLSVQLKNVQLKNEQSKDNEQSQQVQEEFGDFAEQTMEQNVKTVENTPQISEHQISTQKNTYVSVLGNETSLLEVQQRQTEIDHLEENPQQGEISNNNQPQTITSTQLYQQLPVSPQFSKPLTLEDQLAAFLNNLPDYNSIIRKSFQNANQND